MSVTMSYLVIGKTRAGKSSVCNIISNTNSYRVLPTTERVTTEASLNIVSDNFVINSENIKFNMIDTRGFFDGEDGRDTITHELLIILDAVCSSSLPISGIIIVARKEGISPDFVRALDVARSLLKRDAHKLVPVKLLWTTVEDVNPHIVERDIRGLFGYRFDDVNNKYVENGRKNIMEGITTVENVHIVNIKKPAELEFLRENLAFSPRVNGDGVVVPSRRESYPKYRLLEGLISDTRVNRNFRFYPPIRSSESSCVIL